MMISGVLKNMNLKMYTNKDYSSIVDGRKASKNVESD